MPATTTIFLDDGGVMNDNGRRGAQWQRLVAEYLSPRLGGAPGSWAEANKIVADREFEMYRDHLDRPTDLEYLALRDQRDRAWLEGMAELVGVDGPEGDEGLRLARDTAAFATRRVHAAFPGAVDAIRELHAKGFTLYTASAEYSKELEGYLEGMGVRDLFRTLYGPDLVNTAKAGPEYYSRVFEDAGVEPGRAVVVDDSPVAVSRAREAGATAVLVSPGDAATGPAIRSLAGLPAFLAAA